MNILKMFTVWICIECLHRIWEQAALNTNVKCPQQNLRVGGGCQRLKRLVWGKNKKLQMFSNVTV